MIFLFMDWLATPALTIARIAAAIGGAIVGYLLCGFLASGIYRVAFHRPAPRLFVFWGKVLGGLIVGALCYLFLPIGGDGGWGWGAGSGGGPGRGKDDGKDGGKVSKDDKEKRVTDKDKTVKPGVNIETRMTILLLGPKHKVKDNRYYVVDKQAMPEDIAAIKARLQGKEKQIGVVVQLNSDSVSDLHPAVTRLVNELNEMKILHTIETK